MIDPTVDRVTVLTRDAGELTAEVAAFVERLKSLPVSNCTASLEREAGELVRRFDAIRRRQSALFPPSSDDQAAA